MISKRRIWFTLLAGLCCISATAQRKMVVVDIETLIPIQGVNVTSKAGVTATDSLGWFSFPDSCRSLTFSHVNYESRIIKTEEVRDTVFLISKLLNLKEVVIFGKGKYRDDFKELRKQLRMQKSEAQLMAADPSSGGNLLPLLARLIPKKWRKNSKKERMERLKKNLEDY